MLTGLQDGVRERLTAQSASGDMSLFGATPSTFAPEQAGQATSFSFGATTGEAIGVGTGAPDGSAHSTKFTSLALEPGLSLAPQVALSTPVTGDLRASVDLSVDAAVQAVTAQHFADGGPLAPGQSGMDARGAAEATVSGGASVAYAAPEEGGASSIAEAVQQADAVQALGGEAGQVIEAAQIQALADSIRTQLDTLAKLLPTTAASIEDRIATIEANSLEAIQATVAEIASLDLPSDTLGAVAPVLDGSLGAVPAVTGATIDAAIGSAAAAGAGIQGIVEASTGAAQGLVPALGQATDDVGDVAAGAAGSLGGSDVSGGISTLMSLLQAGDGFVVEDAGEAVFGSVDAPLQTLDDLAGEGHDFSGADQDGALSDSLLGIVGHASDGIGGILDQDDGLHG